MTDAEDAARITNSVTARYWWSLPHTAGLDVLRTVNSYSTTPEKPTYRVFIPTTVAMPIAAHKAIGEQIMQTLNRAGYWSKKQLEANERIKSRSHHRFDMGKVPR